MASDSHSEQHGGIDPAELKRLNLSAGQLVDFSVNSNPFGPSARVLEALRQVDIASYPDRSCSALTQQLAGLNGLPEQNILIGNGTAELIWLAAQAFLKPEDKVIICGPTFGEYRRAAAALQAEIIEIGGQEPDFIFPLPRLLDEIQRLHPRLLFLCNPNNPTGRCLPAHTVAELLNVCGSHTILVLDQAYQAFVNGSFFSPAVGQNCLVLRSMTKDFALAGLRLGYALGDVHLIERLKSFQPAWSVNAFAQAAGAAALSDLDYYQHTLAQLRQLQVPFFSDLKSIGCRLLPSDVHFALIRLAYPARDLRLKLLQSAIQVRDCASFGLPQYIRISTRLPADNHKLLDALSSMNSAIK
ncbi:MAG: histidinol-phosphate transaminase [Anaerolineaceae bacterium]|nr:histidinol-phosphate transaminase [Anaerolineaceae bacterium]